VLSSPTTDQILQGLRLEVREAVLPEAQGATARVALEMLDNVLFNLAVRAAHEIAWMREECERIEALAEDIDDHATRSALDAYRAADRDSLHLTDVQGAYNLAGEVLSCAVEHAFASGDVPLREATRDLLRLRKDRELEIMGDWQMVGRG
jgi:hypothetical protein